MDDIVVQSSSGSSTLILSEFSRPGKDGWCNFRVTVEGYGLTASCVIEDHISLSVSPNSGLGDRTGTLGLTRMVANTVEDYDGWKGERRWESLEQQLTVSATFERTGHAVFTVEITKNWRASIELRLDAEQRKRWAREMDTFFRHRDFGWRIT